MSDPTDYPDPPRTDWGSLAVLSEADDPEDYRNIHGHVLDEENWRELQRKILEEGTYADRPDEAPFDGAKYHATDINTVFVWDETAWTPMNTGTSENPVPGTAHYESVDTERVNSSISSNGWLAADGETDDSAALEALIEYAAENHLTIELEAHEEPIRVEETVSPETDGERVVIDSVGSVIDGTELEDYILDFSESSNITIHGPLTIEGTEGDGKRHSIRCGDGFRFNHIELDGGQSGLDCNFSDISGYGLVARGMRHTENGWAAVIEGGPKSDNIFIQNVEGYNSDRGIEFEDGSSNVTILNGHLENIENSHANDPASVFVLDAHTHPDEDDGGNIIYQDFTLKNCERGLTCWSRENSRMDNITFRDIEIIDSGRGGPGGAPIVVRESRDVLLDNVTIRTENASGLLEGPNGVPRQAVEISQDEAEDGSELTIRDLDIHASVDWEVVNMGGEIKTVHFDRVNVYNPEGSSSRFIRSSSDLILRDMTMDSVKLFDDHSWSEALQMSGDDLDDDSGGSVELYNCYMPEGMDVDGLEMSMFGGYTMEVDGDENVEFYGTDIRS